eukprot:COSAG01_NODE_3110_length_6571_cov_218.696539_4_plen_45_part_00
MKLRMICVVVAVNVFYVRVAAASAAWAAACRWAAMAGCGKFSAV